VKGFHFTEEEKLGLLQVQLDLLARIIPTYRALQETGQVELTTSPWAHPILPLLHHTDIARQTDPGMSLPDEPFHFPEDVSWHLQTAVDEYERWFSRRPLGLWPSEGGLSEAVLPAIAQAGFQWVATDEEVLWRSLRMSSQEADPPTRSALYRPYRIQVGDRSIALLFRDHRLSDRIGFVYSGWPAERAVADFLATLRSIEQEASADVPHPMVLVALDGENPWEGYAEDGEPFLRQLYEALSREGAVRCSTVSQLLSDHPPHALLDRLAPGSWIRAEFSTWIGHEPQNRAWEELNRARRLVGPKVSRAMAIAEGSDWFWWLGPEHSSPQDPVFDRLFRLHLMESYRAVGRTPPPALEGPLKPDSAKPPAAPVRFMTPILDGRVTSYFEWLYAGETELTRAGSAMAKARPIFDRLWWGCDASHLYLRLDPSLPLGELDVRVILQEARFRISLMLNRGRVSGSWATPPNGLTGVTGLTDPLFQESAQTVEDKSQRAGQPPLLRLAKQNVGGQPLLLRFASPSVGGQPVHADPPLRAGPTPPFLEIAAGSILELALTLTSIGMAPGAHLTVFIVVEQGGLILERYPEQGQLVLRLPSSEEVEQSWSA
jgi:hypothetical protein